MLCRTDLFERLPSANKNKLRQDSSVTLDWYHDTRNSKDSNLIKLANHRARMVKPSSRDIFHEYFPAKSSSLDIRTFLLDLTKDTPRDFLQLLNKIQNFSTNRTISREDLLNGVRQYSIEYFLPEIRDELHGYVEMEDVDLILDLIGSLRKRDFTFKEMKEKAALEERFKRLKLESIIGALFECSAIGNVQRKSGGITYYTFKFVNRNSTLNLSDGRFCIGACGRR